MESNFSALKEWVDRLPNNPPIPEKQNQNHTKGLDNPPPLDLVYLRFVLRSSQVTACPSHYK